MVKKSPLDDLKNTVILEGGIKVPKKEFCDRCGNDLVKGSYWYNFPFSKIRIVLCHICYQGLLYGFYWDVRKELEGK